MTRVAVLLAIALSYAGAAQAKLPPPDVTFTRTIGGVKYVCAEWGAPPKRLVYICLPRTNGKGKLAA